MSMRCIDLRAGEIYGHQSGGRFLCIWADHGDADLLREDGWRLTAHGVHQNEDGSIWWNFSTSGHFTDQRWKR